MKRKVGVGTLHRMAKKKRTGRPKKKFPLSAHVGFNVKPAQKDRYVEASELAEMDLSEWCRSVLDREAERLLAEEE